MRPSRAARSCRRAHRTPASSKLMRFASRALGTGFGQLSGGRVAGLGPTPDSPAEIVMPERPKKPTWKRAVAGLVSAAAVAAGLAFVPSPAEARPLSMQALTRLLASSDPTDPASPTPTPTSPTDSTSPTDATSPADPSSP